MIRVGHLFEKAFSEDNLYRAYLDARKGKRKKYQCYRFGVSLGSNIRSLLEELYNGNYKPQPYRKFKVYEPKERVIYAPTFRDIVVQHAIYRIIYPIFDRCFISTVFSCRIGYGIHKASDYVQSCLRDIDNELHYLKLDVRKYFYTIDRSILRKLIERKIKDTRFIDTMMLFAEYGDPLGIPIGNLLSQIYALIYLNPLDHFIKRELKIKYYVRYVDDFILLGLTREDCFERKIQIEEFLKKKLNLTLSRFTIQKLKRGINFVGYRTWKNRRLIRKYSLTKFRRNVKAQKVQSVISVLGHARKTSSLRHMFQQIEQNESLYSQIPIKCKRWING